MSEGPIAPCHCLTIEPSQPQVGDVVTLTLYIDGVQVPAGPEDELICFGAPGDVELCPEAAINDDGSFSLEWDEEIQEIVDLGGWAWVWWGENFFEDDGALAEVNLADLIADGVGCSSCAGDCDNPPEVGGEVEKVPAAGGFGLALLAGAIALGGASVLRCRRK